MPADDVDLKDDEINRICRPLTQGAAQVRYLKGLGLTVKRRADGTPLVARAHFNEVMGQRAKATVADALADGEPVWGCH